MKSFLALASLLCLPISVFSQTRESKPYLDRLVTSQVLERGTNHRVEANITRRTDEMGRTFLQTNTYTIVANGMNVRGTDGQLRPATPVVQEIGGLIVCTGASFRVILNTNLNTYGSIDFETVDQKRIVSHPLSIGFYDPESGKSVVLAQLQDTRAELVSSNLIVYRDSFAGNGIRASVTYGYRRGGFNQDVTIERAPNVSPADFGLSEKTRLEVLTELVSSPVPVRTSTVLKRERDESKRARMVEPDLIDEKLDFGAMDMVLGRAFPSEVGKLRGVAVAKRLIRTPDDRVFLTEAVEWGDVKDHLEKLPRQAGIGSQAKPLVAQQRVLPQRRGGEVERLPFETRLAQATEAGEPRLAMNWPSLVPPHGFVMDYDFVTDLGFFTFSAQTYLVEGDFYIGYMFIQDGAVIKFASGSLNATYFIECPASGRAVITHMDDDSVGETIWGSDHHPSISSYTGLNLWGLQFDSYIHNLDIRFMYYGIQPPYPYGEYPYWIFVWDCYFFGCWEGFENHAPVNVSFSDFCHVYSPFAGNSWFYEITYCSSSVDRNGNNLSDAWEYQHFGELCQTAAGDYDGDGISNATEASWGTDPNTIVFGIEATNNYVATTQPALQLGITAGVPRSYAVLVNSTNYAAATWQTFATTNLIVNLGGSPTQGWHELWVGLKGGASTSTATWIWKRLKFDTIPPNIVITNPATGTVNVPMIQLAGYSPEELDGISCNLSNALGVITNVDIGTTERYHDEVTWEFTTNYFECLDLDLTNGLNRITIIATDLAGNVTTSNFNFTLDYTGKPAPVVTLMWPTNSMKLAGNKFTWIGYVTDPTATVVGQSVNAAGVTNQVEADVERDGRFWVDNLPLSAGTNWLTLTVKDAVNPVATTNIWVTQSTLSLGMTPVTPESDLWKPKVNLTGTINDSTQAVWVNGVKGHNHGDGTWSADDVPTTPGGVAIFRIDAYEANEQQPDGSYGNP